MIPATLALIVTNFPPRPGPPRDRAVDRGHRRGAGNRPGARRGPDESRDLAGDLLPEHPARADHLHDRACSPRENPATSMPRGGSTIAGIVTLSLGLTAGVLAVIEAELVGLDLGAHRRPPGRFGGRAGAVRRDRAAQRGADPAAGDLPQPAVPRHQHRGLRADVLGARGVAVHGDLHAGGARLQRPEGRTDVPAGHGPDRAARPGVGPPGRALRGIAGHRGRNGLPRRRGRRGDAADRDHGLRRDRGRDGRPRDRDGARRRADLAPGDRVCRGAVRRSCVGRVRDVATDRCRRRRGRLGAVVQSVGRTRAAQDLAALPLPPAAQAAIAHSVGSGPPSEGTSSRPRLRNRSPPPCTRRWLTRSRGRDS